MAETNFDAVAGTLNNKISVTTGSATLTANSWVEMPWASDDIFAIAYPYNASNDTTKVYVAIFYADRKCAFKSTVQQTASYAMLHIKG